MKSRICKHKLRRAVKSHLGNTMKCPCGGRKQLVCLSCHELDGPHPVLKLELKLNEGGLTLQQLSSRLYLSVRNIHRQIRVLELRGEVEGVVGGGANGLAKVWRLK